jgi:NAD+ kinase
VSRLRSATVFTHRRPVETGPALTQMIELAEGTGATLRFDPEETRKLRLSERPGVLLNAEVRSGVDMCFALGGDGTMLSALRAYAGTGVPVFGINFGEVGFLAAVDREHAFEGVRRAFDGDYDVVSLPAIELSCESGRHIAINDVSIHRQPGLRVADLEYGVGQDDVGRVKCDGLVIATPVGSTGYNLANGGPVMAWGVQGFVVSFIAPHSLTARTLVVAPGDLLSVHNRSQEEPVDVMADGRPVCTIEAGQRIEASFVHDQGRLAQVAGTTFYQRLAEKFGRLATP